MSSLMASEAGDSSHPRVCFVCIGEGDGLRSPDWARRLRNLTLHIPVDCGLVGCKDITVADV